MNTDPNKYYQEEQDNLRNWQNYLSETHERNNQMWNTILYNQFVNEEVRRLNRQIYYLKKDLKLEKDRVENIQRENDSLVKDLRKYKPPPKKRKRSELTKWISNEKRKKPKKYNNLDNDEINAKLKRIFENLNSIDDIIDFENDPNRFDLLKNSKYEKLYKLIPSCKELKKIIGMEKVKDNVFKQLSYFLHGLNSSGEINHVVITGEPGVGKTTLAKIIAKIYLAMGFLKNEKFLEAKRSDLIGEYCGHTAVKTQKVIDSIDGGVLFIDEVYSLGNREKKDVFTKECIDTINQNLTEKSDKFLCIIAGYKEEVETCFFNYNKGLERRFPVRFNLESYEEESLKKILLKFMDEEGWKLDNEQRDLEDQILGLIKKNKDILKFQAGDIKTIFQMTKEKYSMRLLKESIYDGAGEKILKLEDFKYSFEKFKTLRDNKQEIPEFVKNLYI